MSYLHIDIVSKQSSKKEGDACGDYFAYHRNEDSIIIVLSDGLGSGVKANISAHLIVNRLLALFKNGASLNKAFSILTKSMNKQWGKGHPFAVFSVLKILNNGDATVLSYEMPPPLLLSKNFVSVLSQRAFTIEKAIIHESNYKIKNGEGIMLMSDGITQAGIGQDFIYGWETSGVQKFVSNLKLNQKAENTEIPELVHDKARDFWKKAGGDDCSVVLANCRNGITLNIITGPPVDKEKDKKFVEDYINTEGIKIVCGGTTSKVVARELKKEIKIDENSGNSLSPPKSEIEGITLVTEGVVTLNQVYNILDEDTSEFINDSSVYELNDLLQYADKIKFLVGGASNPGIGNIQFRQQGILARNKIIPIIAKKLRDKGKLVVIKEY